MRQTNTIRKSNNEVNRTFQIGNNAALYIENVTRDLNDATFLPINEFRLPITDTITDAYLEKRALRPIGITPRNTSNESR